LLYRSECINTSSSQAGSRKIYMLRTYGSSIQHMLLYNAASLSPITQQVQQQPTSASSDSNATAANSAYPVQASHLKAA
jgi:hypothetical protein